MEKTNNCLSNVFCKIEGSPYCPNFFVTGDSCSVREKTGFEIVNRICERKDIEFRGIEKYFTVRMPYCTGAKDMNSFLSHLQNSVSIARDCYDVFKGIVIVELDHDWANNNCGENTYLFFDYIKTNESTCFVLLFPGTIKQDQCRTFYNYICDFGYWVSIEATSPTVEYCIKLFVEEASKMGYKVNSDALDNLKDLLENRSKEYTDNDDAVEQLLKRIDFERVVTGTEKKEIVKEDILCISGQKSLKPRIGFGTENR